MKFDFLSLFCIFFCDCGAAAGYQAEDAGLGAAQIDFVNRKEKKLAGHNTGPQAGDNEPARISHYEIH
jgi:hypothetical protein